MGGGSAAWRVCRSAAAYTPRQVSNMMARGQHPTPVRVAAAAALPPGMPPADAPVTTEGNSDSHLETINGSAEE